MIKIPKKRAFLYIFITLLLAIMGYLLWLTFHKTATGPLLQTASVTKGNLLVGVTASGSIVSAGNTDITTTVSGMVDKLYVSPGQTVNAGQKIADVKLDQAAVQNQDKLSNKYKNLQGTLESAKIALSAAQTSYQAEAEKNRVLRATIPPASADQLLAEQAALETARKAQVDASLAVQQANRDLSTAWVDYQAASGTIYSPASGVIADVKVVAGINIPGGTKGFVIATIQSKNQVLASISVSEMDISRVSIGQKVLLSIPAINNQSVTGKITAIDTSGAAKSGVIHYSVTVSIDNPPAQLLSNMSTDVNIILAEKDNVLLIPSSAIKTTNNQTSVTVVKNSKTSIVVVKVGLSNNTQAEILSGLSLNDTVVTGTQASQQPASSSTSIFNGITSPSGSGIIPGASQNN